MQIRRPNNYDYNIAVTLGFTEPNPVIDLNQLEIVRTVVQDSPNKLFIGGLPCEWTADQVSHAKVPPSHDCVHVSVCVRACVCVCACECECVCESHWCLLVTRMCYASPVWYS